MSQHLNLVKGNGQQKGSTLAYNDEKVISNLYLLHLQEAQVQQELIKRV